MSELEKSSLQKLRTFDAFPKTSAENTVSSTKGGITTLIIGLILSWLTWSELSHWYFGEEVHQFTMIPGVGHEMQLNVDLTIAMPCEGKVV